MNYTSAKVICLAVALSTFLCTHYCNAALLAGRERGQRRRSRRRYLKQGAVLEAESSKSCKEQKNASKGKGKGKGKGGSHTCSESRYSSSLAIIRIPVNSTPSPITRAKPTPSPFEASESRSTSSSEDSSNAPSPSPSAKPSVEDSVMPSVTHSSSPSATPSSAPSTSPSDNPTGTPSRLPSWNPSISPSETSSLEPSTGPTFSPSLGPSSLPSRFPSAIPSTSPSNKPSRKPSNLPSASPSLSQPPSSSMHPSIAAYNTVSTTLELRSACNDPEPSKVNGGHYHEDQWLVFRYISFLPDTLVEREVMDEIVELLGVRIHEGLARNFLTCGIVPNQDFSVWSVSRIPPDAIVADPCEAQLVEDTSQSPPEGSRCILVQAVTKMEVYFPPTRHNRQLGKGNSRLLTQSAAVTSADPQVISTTGDYLRHAMDEGDFNHDNVVFLNRFVGFVTEEEGHPIVDAGMTKVVAAVNGQLMMEQKDSKLIGGAMTTAMAAFCLLIVAFLAIRRRKQRSEAFFRHASAISTMEKEDDFFSGTEIVGELDDNSLEWFSDDINDGIDTHGERDTSAGVPLDYQHDVHKCTSAFCSICLKQQNPTFVASNSFNIPDILEDLRCYSADDTVIL